MLKRTATPRLVHITSAGKEQQSISNAQKHVEKLRAIYKYAQQEP